MPESARSTSSAASSRAGGASIEKQLSETEIKQRRHLEILRRRRVDQDASDRLLDQHRLIGRGGNAIRLDRKRVAQRVDPEHLRRLRCPETVAVEGLLYDEG